MQASTSIHQPHPLADRERTFHWADPMISARAGRDLTGLQIMNKIKDGELPPPPIAVMMDFEIDLIEEGHVVFASTPGEHLYNPIGVVHGGFACALLDTVLGCSIHTRLAEGVGYGTTDIHARMLRPIMKTTGRVIAEGRVVHLGKTIATSQATLVDSNGKLLATGTTACALFPMR